MNIAAIMAGAALLALGSAGGSAQPASEPVAAAALDSAAVVADVRRILAANYVLADVRPKLDAALARGLADGRYQVAEPAELASRITADLAAIAHDKHLGMRYDPAEQARLAAAPPSAGQDDGPPSEAQLRQATSFNHGILELKLLPGNLRYMKLNGFMWGGKPSAEAHDVAMRFLRDGDAAIIDLRENGGGSPDAVQYLASHFVEPNRHLVTFHMGADRTDRRMSLPQLPAGRMVGKPLYVLTSTHTASAAEEFAGHVAGFGLGELVGETTAGAGFRNSFFPVAGGYVISVSVGRAVLASTGKDWENTGIAPTVRIDSAKALELAQARALRKLAASAPAGQKPRLEAQATVLEARLNPVAPALPLTSYAGTFGERTVAVEGGGLTWQRAGGPKTAMVALGPNEFTFAEDPMTRVSFTLAGNTVAALQLVRGDGSTVEVGRTQ